MIEKIVRKIDSTKTMIDEIDEEFYDSSVSRVGISSYKSSSGKSYPYVICFEKGTKGKQFHLHRAIMERVKGRKLIFSEKVDHIDGNPLNNTRDNLRICSHSQNMFNSKKRSNSKSITKGISFDKARNRWKVYITANGINYQKRFKELDEALNFANNLRKNLHGEFYNHG